MKKLTVEFNGKVEAILERLKKETGKSRAEILRQGLILRDYFQKQSKNGKHISVTSGNKIEKEVILT